ncbi:hypothetical protein E4U58_006431 [Claviceps cyperi]|nr:hypothetical protein E4U58_006431 [Claviceps cyperi]
MVKGVFAGFIVQVALAVSAPADKRWNCATIWYCGGKDWTGTRCCSNGSVCIAQNPWYSQCLPRSQTVACETCPHPTVYTSPASSVSSFTARVTTPVRSAATSSVTYTADDPFTDTETDDFDDGYITDMEPDPFSSVASSSATRSVSGSFTYTKSGPARTAVTTSVSSTVTGTALGSGTKTAPAPVYTSDDDDSDATDYEPAKSRPTRTAATSFITTYVTSTVASSVASSFSLPPNCFCTEPARRPVYSSATSSVTSSAPAEASGSAAWKGNPYSGVDIWLNTDYASSIRKRAIPCLAGAMATAAEKVAKTPTFYWMDSLSKTPVMENMLADIRAANRKGGNYAGQFVVYDLPDRDCAAAASSGEFTIRNDGVAKYKNYIDTIRKIVLAYSDVRIMLIIEPDSLSNMVTNLNISKCSEAKSAYLEGVNYALRRLNLPNVAMYLDAGHAGWLGWPANQDSAAQLFAKVYKDAGSPSSLRGLVTNVANYNGWDTATPPRYTTGNVIYDEKHYIHALSPLLERHGWAGARFITDQGRAGRQPTGQTSWSHWCNAKGTGFGIRPSANTGDPLLDAFVWVKPGGESDGTSKVSSRRYDYHCGFEDALKPAPEAGQWFHEHFVQLLRNANPPFL